MAFHYYDPERVVRGRKMKDWFRFSMAWWHTLCAEGQISLAGERNSFRGMRRRVRWNVPRPKWMPVSNSCRRWVSSITVFHDVDLIDEAPNAVDYERNLKEIVAYAKQKQAETGIKLLWGTANVFGHPRYMNGASTNPDFDAAARAMLQIKNAIDATIELGGECYVFGAAVRATCRCSIPT